MGIYMFIKTFKVLRNILFSVVADIFGADYLVEHFPFLEPLLRVFL